MDKNTPLDLKAVSIFLFFSAFSFLSVNTDYNYFLGITVTGFYAKLLWAISSVIMVLGAIGIWKRNLILLYIIIAYFIFKIIDYLMWYFFIPLTEKALIIPTTGEPHVLNASTTTFYFVFFISIEIVFIVYLMKRKSLFK